MNTMITMSLVGTESELAQWRKDMAKVGWRLTYQGNSGHWLGEPVYSLRKKESSMKENYVEIEGSLQVKLILAVQIELGRSLTDAEEDKLRSIITERDVAGMLGEASPT